MSLTLAQAAAACGLDKSTVRRAVKSGRISGTRDEHGVWRVEAAELHRYWPPRAATEEPAQALNFAALPDTAQGAAERTGEAATGLLVQTLQGVIEDLRKDRDHWRDLAEQRTLPKPAERMSWWRWLRSRE